MDRVWVREIKENEVRELLDDPRDKVRKLAGVRLGEQLSNLVIAGTYEWNGSLRTEVDWKALVSGVDGLNMISLHGLQTGTSPSRIEALPTPPGLHMDAKIYTSYQSGYGHIEVRDVPREDLISQATALLVDPAGAIRLMKKPADEFSRTVMVLTDDHRPSPLKESHIHLTVNGPAKGQLKVIVTWIPKNAPSGPLSCDPLYDTGKDDPPPPPPNPDPVACVICVGGTTWQGETNCSLDVHTIMYNMWFLPPDPPG